MISLDINGKRQNVDLPGETPLLWTLRDELGLTGTKFGCGMALCGACTVHVDGQAVRSCITPISAVASKKIVTIEAVGADAVGKALQAAWVDIGSAPVRLLSGRPDHVRGRAAEAQAEADRRRDRRGHERQHLPLRDLHAYPRRHQAGGGPAGRDAMNAPVDRIPMRGAMRRSTDRWSWPT